MPSIIETTLHSLEEISKKNVKRNSAVLASKFSLLYSFRNRILSPHVIHIAKHVIRNNLQLQETPRLLLSHLIPKVIDQKGLSILDSSILSYAYATVGENHSSKKILVNNFDICTLDITSNYECFSLLRALSTLLSIEKHDKIEDEFSNTMKDIAKGVMEFIWKRIQEFNSKFVDNSNNYTVICELLAEYIFTSMLLEQTNIKELLNHTMLNNSSILSKIKISPLMMPEKKKQIMAEIQNSSYTEILTNLRGMYFLKLANFDFTEYLFNRLCNTSESSTSMCRSEAQLFLNHTLDLIEKELKFGQETKTRYLNSLFDRLLAIKRTHSLEKSHRSVVKWNYPRLI
ncbi:hypothetical protein BEWA_018630 [Theileria equi strain WA]|uniref:Uncharacterized protein n=1 Tax=Theileria equi strain WA TaxID=1537102 RepID=L0AUV5_THEEQ|nr:hypothetical protein BEWA_018630 [Theileria equi strain WA]AFZ79018.1 hypothetical protein BEWA_018630 [Theileria equi strain WA]|eukprot:XP_004828684.1 hypothetical protein BEWA_018630 [Theileria equi strain WA]